MNQLRAAYVGEKEELEAQLVETERMATVGTLATSAIHEIRNPLTAVHGFAELLQLDLPPDSPAHESLDVIIEQVEHINRIAERIMDLAHPNPEDFQVAMPTELIDATLRLFGNRLQKLNVELRKEYPRHPLFVNAMPGQIQQVFLNLLLNALQAMPEGGTMSVRVDRRELGGEEASMQVIEVEIEDEGTGIPEEDMPHIFAPFFTTKPKGTGTGLGLYVCRTIVEQHGGTISARSRPGEGTTMTVRLPAVFLEDE
jgi:signal transduction histidine kinase